MTTTSTFQGLNEGAKNSSRVLAPPGGGSSNIFGFAQEDKPSPKQQQRQAAPEPSAPSQPPAAAAPEPAQRNRQQRSAVNPITGEPLYPSQAKSQEPEAEVSGEDDKKDADAPEPQKVSAPAKPSESTTSTRVSQPPGGRCHQLW